MSAPLLANFALLAASEGGVAKLREFILSLAVRGKLVPQDPADEPASELLKRIRAEKERLVAEGKIKREKKSPRPPFDKGGPPSATPTTSLASLAPPFAKGGLGGIETADEEAPFELPEGWEWSSFAMLGSFGGGKTPSTVKSDYWGGEIPWITPKDMKSLVISDAQDKVTQRAVEDGLAIFETNSVMVVVRSGILRRMVPVAINARPCTVNQDLKVLTLAMPEMAAYVQLMIRGFEAFILQTLTKVGTTVESIRFDDFEKQPFPLPPLPEQSRIVAKVEALMALCDRLEAQQGEAARVQAHWTQAALDQLAASGDADEFARHWQALADHFDTLFATPASIDALDATLLQLAVRGKLVPQNPADEPASELLKKIRTEKDRLIAEGKIKRDKPLPPIADDEKPFELPKGWEWTRSSDVYDFLNGYAFKSDWFQETGIRLLRNINVVHGQLEWSQKACITEDRIAEFERFALDLGDIVISLDRPIISTGLKYAVVRESDLPCLLLQRVAKLWPRARTVVPRYTELWLRSDVFVSSIDPGRSNGVPHISTKQIEAIPFPLPPVPEQSRIVAKLDELLALTRTLRARLADARAVQARLASALVDEVAA